jgi:hypothetical protein
MRERCYTTGSFTQQSRCLNYPLGFRQGCSEHKHNPAEKQETGQGHGREKVDGDSKTFISLPRGA